MTKEVDVMSTLKDLRILMGLTQEEVATKIGVSCLTYRRWEYGTAVPSVKHLGKLADALNCTSDEIVKIFI